MKTALFISYFIKILKKVGLFCNIESLEKQMR